MLSCLSPRDRHPHPTSHSCTHTHTHTHTYTHTLLIPVQLPNSQAMKCTSHLRSEGIAPQILPLNYWRGPSQLDSDYPPINMPRLSSYNIKCLRRSIQPIRVGAAARNAECIVVHCLQWHHLARVIGVYYARGQAWLLIDCGAPVCFCCLVRVTDNSTCLSGSRR